MINDWSHQTLLSLQISHNIGVILLSIHVIIINSFTQLSQISCYHTLCSFSTIDKMEFTVIGSGLFIYSIEKQQNKVIFIGTNLLILST